MISSVAVFNPLFKISSPRAGPRDADVSLRVSIQLYQAVLIAVVTIPELQFRAQDLLQQSRMWVIGEQMRRIERLASGRRPAALPASSVEALTDGTGASVPSHDDDLTDLLYQVDC